MATAYGDDERGRLADEFGGAEVIAKPVDFDLLKAQLRQLPPISARAPGDCSREDLGRRRRG